MGRGESMVQWAGLLQLVNTPFMQGYLCWNSVGHSVLKNESGLAYSSL